MKILFYSSVKNIDDFNTQKFYTNDIYCLREAGFTVHLTNKVSDFLFPLNYDLAFIYFFRKGLFPAIIASLLLKRVFFTGGIDDLSLSKNSFGFFAQKILFKLCYFFSTNVFFVSSSDQFNAESAMGCKFLRKAVLSPHSIYSLSQMRKVFNIDVKKRPGIFSTICWMSTISNVKRKGVDKALLLFKSYLESNDGIGTFYIVGRIGPGTEYLIECIKSLQLEGKVIFTDSISEFSKHRLLFRSQYYIQLSRYEGFGVAALEALAHNNLVIHSGNGGLRDSIGAFGIEIDLEKFSFELNNTAWIDSLDSNTMTSADRIKIFKHLINFTHEERTLVFKRTCGRLFLL
jgi:glycosyltransferase involved in cell wall biosynthesis